MADSVLIAVIGAVTAIIVALIQRQKEQNRPEPPPERPSLRRPTLVFVSYFAAGFALVALALSIYNAMHPQATGVEGISLDRKRIVSGSIASDKIIWTPHGTGNGIHAYVDTSAAGFKATPRYFTSIGGDDVIWSAGGAACIYDPSPTGFHVYLLGLDTHFDSINPDTIHTHLTTDKAKEVKIMVNWIAIGD